MFFFNCKIFYSLLQCGTRCMLGCCFQSQDGSRGMKYKKTELKFDVLSGPLVNIVKAILSVDLQYHQHSQVLISAVSARIRKNSQWHQDPRLLQR